MADRWVGRARAISRKVAEAVALAAWDWVPVIESPWFFRGCSSFLLSFPWQSQSTCRVTLELQQWHLVRTWSYIETFLGLENTNPNDRYLKDLLVLSQCISKSWIGSSFKRKQMYSKVDMVTFPNFIFEDTNFEIMKKPQSWRNPTQLIW